MPISAGDVVLTFTADMTQLDAAFNKVANETAAKLQPAVSAMGGLGQAAQATGKASTDAGTSLADAWKLIPPAVQHSESRLLDMSFALRGIAPVAEEVSERITSTMRHGMAEISEVSHQAFGIGLPRSIRAFLLEMPGVATAMEAAFSVISILLLIDIIARVIEKVVEFTKHAEKVSQAWDKADEAQRQVFEGLENKIIKAQIKLDELTGKHLEALRLKLELIDRESLSGLQAELNKIAKGAQEAFKEMNTFASGLQALLVGAEGPKDVSKEFEKVQKSVQDALNTKTPEAFNNALKLLNGPGGEIEKATKRLEELEKQQEKISKAPTTAGLPGGFRGPDLAPQIELWQRLKDKAVAYTAAIQDAQKANELEDKAEKKSDAGKRLEEKIADLKRSEQIEVASIELVKAKAEQAFAERKISAKQAADIEVKAAFDARKANEDYLQKVVDLYKKAGDAQKAHAAQQELEKTKLQNLVKATQDKAKADEFLNQENKKFDELSRKTIHDMEEFGEQLDIVRKIDPLKGKVKSAADLEKALKDLGITGFGTLVIKENEAAKAEQTLTDAGMKNSKLWLQVHAQRLKAIIAEEQAQKRSAESQIKELKKVESQIREYDGIVKNSKSQVAAAWIGEALAAAFAADSVGAAAEAILNSILKNLSGMAFAKGTEQLAEGFARLNPVYAAIHGPPGPHFMAAAEWFTLGGVAGIAGAAMGGGGKSGSSSESSGPSIDSGSSANHPAQQPVSTINVAHLASGGLVDRPMMAEIGHGREVVLPLDNESVIQAFRERVGANGPITVIVEGIPLHKLSRRMSSDQKKGKYRVHSTSSARTIRQY